MTHFKDDNAIPPQLDVCDPVEYCSLSKQIWLDVLFQTYKIMILQRLIFGDKKLFQTSAKTTCPSHIKYMNSIKNIARNQHLFSITELLLLDWMQFHYNEVRETIWHEHPFLAPKDMTCFDDGMEDGFVFAALTIAYCPYLIDHFSDLYFDPIGPDDMSHNNITIIRAWKILNFSYKFTVKDLGKNNATRNLFLAVYLYQMLPNMYPSQTMEFEAGLSQRTKKSFNVKNANDFPVAYKAILYGSEDGSFEIDQDFYVIPPKSKTKICIEYWAKYIKQSKRTLILSGECSGYRYAKSMVISLVGVPNVQYVTDTIEARGVFYLAEKINITVTSPYKKPGIYRTQHSAAPKVSWSEVEAFPYAEDVPKYTIIRLTILQYHVEFNEEGVANIDFCMTILTPRIITFRLYFRNPEVGEFAINFITGPKLFSLQESLRMNVPVIGDYVFGTTKKERTAILQIPNENKLIWRALLETFVKTSGEDIEIWREMSRKFLPPML